MKYNFKKIFIVGLVLFTLVLNLGVYGYSRSKSENNLNSLEFWLKNLKQPNKIIMNEEEIEDFNKEIFSIINTKTYDLKNYVNSLTKEELTQKINSLPVPTKDRYNGEQLVDSSYYVPIIENINLSGLQETNEVRYGFTVRRTDLRTLPTKDPSYTSPNDIGFDYFQETAIEAVEPILVLYESLDKKWSFIQTVNYCGWVFSEDIALTNTKEEWLAYLNDNNFIIITANKITLNDNPYNPSLSELELGMGCKIAVYKDKEKPYMVDGMASLSHIVAKIPTRGDDGIFVIKDALIPSISDINHGYLKYTKANILKQAFKLLGDRYGWGGLFGSRDCTSLVCDVFRCFGIMVPRNSSQQIVSAGETINLTTENYDERLAILSKLDVGSILYMKGHAMIYLGDIKGKPYVIHSFTSYYKKPEGSSNLERIYVNGVAVTDLDICKSSGITYLESLISLKTLK